MTRREVRERLKKWARVPEKIAAKEAQHKALVDEIDAVGDLRAQNLDGMPHSGNVGKPTEQAAIKRIGLEERYSDRFAAINREIEELERFRDRINGALLFTSPNEEAVIRMKYIDGMTDEQIAIEMDCTDRNVRYMERKAVDTIAENLTD